MATQFTQQILLGHQPLTFLFTKTHAGDTESVYLVNVLDNDVIRPFYLYRINNHYEIMNENVPGEIRDIQFQLNQAINNYHKMQSLLNMPSSIDEPKQVNNNSFF